MRADGAAGETVQWTVSRTERPEPERGAALIGANVTGKTVTLDAGRDLTLISQQNQSQSSSSSFNVGVTFTGGVPTGAALGVSLANAKRTYTDAPTTIVAEEELTAYAGRNTLLAGAGMWSKTAKLKLDTGDLRPGAWRRAFGP